MHILKLFGSLVPSFSDHSIRICMCNDKRNCSRLPVSCLMVQKVLLRRVFSGSVLLFLLSFIVFSALHKKKKIIVIPIKPVYHSCDCVEHSWDRCGDWGPFFKVPPPSSLCCSLSDDKNLLIQVLLSGTARVATIVAALKDVQVAELVTSGVLADYSATSEGACWLGEMGEQPVALKQQGTYSQSPR